MPTEDDHVRGGMDWKLMHRWIAARNVTENQGGCSIDLNNFLLRLGIKC